MGQFGMGQAVRRKEDIRLITGTGQFTDDVSRAGQVYAAFLRSPHAHARIKSIDTAAAKAAPGVIAVFTYKEVAEDKLGTITAGFPMQNRDGTPSAMPPRTMLAGDRARCVGDPLALVIAETTDEAKDAVELIDVDYEPLPAVLDPAAAAAPGAPLLHDEAPGNVAVDWGFGDLAAVEAAFAKAAKVVALDLVINRIVVAAMEPRSVVGDYDPASGRYTAHLGTQGVHLMRDDLAEILGVEKDKVRVLTTDVGGGFGMKGANHPEHVLIPWAARRVGRPVKWTADRQESFLSDTQGRDQRVHVELALDSEGHFLGIRVNGYANVGAYLSKYSVAVPTFAGYRLLTGVYRIPAAYTNIKVMLTNSVWVDAYRGAGRPEVSYIVERTVDAAARAMGIAPDEIRRRNFIQPDAFPYTTPMYATYDSGDFPAAQAKALKAADWAGYPARRDASLKRGKRRGIGMAYYVEVTAPGPIEKADIRFTEDGRLVMGIGVGPSGQGHETAFAQIVEDKLGVPFDKVDLVFGDTDKLTQGGGTGGAKSLMLAGTALFDAADKIVAKGRKLAGHVLEAAEQDIQFADGTFTISGTDRAIHILDLAREARNAKALPEGVPSTLDDFGMSTSDSATFPNGCHICELEIDEETGVIEIASYTVVDDFGRLINPMIVEGQIHGGLAQGIGQAILENAVFDNDSGQFISGSFMDYAMPRASDMPNYSISWSHVPCTTNAMGIKGAGEAGSVGSMGATMNAVHDALAPLGVTRVDMPATPNAVWRAITAAKVA